ncbi:MAG: type III pantothenate kinase [Verrucomicrobiota bacterium]
MNLLTIDIGNTRSHWAFFEKKKLVARGAESSRDEECEFTHLFTPEDQRLTPDAVIASSVVPRLNTPLSQQASDSGLRCEFLTWENTGPLRLHHPHPEGVGTDRFASALGAISHYAPPLVVVDMGTAVTVDAVTAKNGFEGGCIAPGLSMLSEYLSERISLLPKIDLSTDQNLSGIGRSTLEATEIGCKIGFTGMVRELISTVSEEIQSIDGKAPQVVLTGGSFPLISKGWLGQFPYFPDLAHEGLRTLGDFLLQSS